MECGHCFCYGCWRGYLKERIAAASSVTSELATATLGNYLRLKSDFPPLVPSYPVYAVQYACESGDGEGTALSRTFTHKVPLLCPRRVCPGTPLTPSPFTLYTSHPHSSHPPPLPPPPPHSLTSSFAGAQVQTVPLYSKYERVSRSVSHAQTALPPAGNSSL